MLGLMQDRPLLISSLIESAALNHNEVEIVSRTVEGPIHRYTYKDCAARSRHLAKSLEKLGIKQGDRIGTLAKWQLPDDVIFVDELPHTATGKILKTKLRSDYKDYKLPTVAE